MATLHVIGNGFDLFHNLPTSYRNFFDYVKASGEGAFLDQLDMYFGKSEYWNGRYVNILWSQLEKALGIYNVDEIMDSMFEGHSFDEDHPSRSIGEVDAEVEYSFVPIRETFSRLFSEWVRSIDLLGTAKRKIKHFDPAGEFLTFNYTNTLEQVYGISEMQVLHIHGDASVRGDDIIVGHDNKFTRFKRYPEDFYDRDEYQRQIAGVINTLYKDTQAIIARNPAFFNSLSSVDKVVIYGHSLEDVDRPYFVEIKRHVKPDATWWLSKYQPEEQASKRAFCRGLGIKGQNIHTFML